VSSNLATPTNNTRPLTPSQVSAATITARFQRRFVRDLFTITNPDPPNIIVSVFGSGT